MTEKQIEPDIIKELLRVFPEVFPIESEETVRGFPDILAESTENTAYHFELKVVHPDGTVRFERSQPVFYRRNWRLNILCLLYQDKDHIYIVSAQQVAGHDVCPGHFPVAGLYCISLQKLSWVIQRYVYFGLSVFGKMQEGNK